VNPTDAERLAKKFIKELAPPRWNFAWSRARTQLGLCSEIGDKHHPPRTIYLSRPLVLLNDQAVIEDTILHEIAHARVGNAAGHGKKWQAEARRLGARPERCTDGAVMVEGNVIATCPRCGISFRAHKVTYALAKKQACGPCYRNGHTVHWVLTRADTGERIDISKLKKPARRRTRRRSYR
jgi:predicted SprT family Zn-dependent metalloprotease